MLHAQKCVLCNQNNYFFDETLNVDRQNDAIVRDLLIKLQEYKKRGGQAPVLTNFSPRQEVPEVITPQHDGTPKKNRQPTPEKPEKNKDQQRSNNNLNQHQQAKAPSNETPGNREPEPADYEQETDQGPVQELP